MLHPNYKAIAAIESFPSNRCFLPKFIPAFVQLLGNPCAKEVKKSDAGAPARSGNRKSLPGRKSSGDGCTGRKKKLHRAEQEYRKDFGRISSTHCAV